MMSGLSHARLKELLNYSPSTGIFIWKANRGGNARTGSVAGRKDSKGHVQISVDGNRYLAHRLAWFYMTGCWPKHAIDHIDLSRENNKFSNLREATTQQNITNRKKQINNRSGYKGVCWSKAANAWVAQISIHGEKRYLGLFRDPIAAHAAYCEAAKRLFGEFWRSA